MPLLTSAIRGLAGVAKSDALKEAERLLAPKPGFYSKLEEAITGLNFTKMPAQQLRKTMEGRQVSPLEYDNVLGHMEGTVSKEEVMGMIGKNKTELKDVTLGGDKFEGWSDNKIRQFYEEQTGESSTGLNINQIRNNMSDPEFFDAETASKVFKGKTHYEQWSEPGYVPGSYRERFVTAPDNYKYTPRKLTAEFDKDNEEWLIKDGIDVIETVPNEGQSAAQAIETANITVPESKFRWQDGHSAYSAIQNPVVRIRYNDRIVDLPKESYSFTDWKNKVQKAYPDETHTDEGWNKLYKISNGTMSDKYIKGKRILFVEEMQGPSKENQDKMPEFLRKRIYDIGVKKVLMLAKEGGYDGVAWTTGEMQASRYGLSKQVNKISWNRLTPTGIKDLFIDIKGHGTTHIQYDPINNIVTAPDGGSTVFGTKVKLEDVVGKNIAEQIVSNNVGNLSGLDLKVGGEGLKYLYDKQLPSLFKKYGKEGVESINIVPKGKANSFTLVKELRKYVSAETDFGSEVFHQLSNVADFIEKGGVPKEARLKYITNEKALAAYKRIIEDVFSMKVDVPYIPITKKTPSRHPVYSMIPPTLTGIMSMYNRDKDNGT